MKLKAKILEELINESIRDIKIEGYDNECFLYL